MFINMGMAGAPGFPAKENGLFQAIEKALLSGKPEFQVRQSGKTVKQTIFCPALRTSIALAYSLTEPLRTRYQSSELNSGERIDGKGGIDHEDRSDLRRLARAALSFPRDLTTPDFSRHW
jgi:hypothetical protein